MRQQTWDALYEDLISKMNSQEAVMAFKKYRQQQTELEAFKNLSALIAFLTTKGGDLDQKDRIYSALAEIAQNERKMGLALRLLFVGLWPGLDAIYHRRFKYHRNNPDELASELFDHFVRLVLNAKLERINRVAATFVRSTERNICDEQKCNRKLDSKKNKLPKDDILVDYNTVDFHQYYSEFDLPPGLPADQVIIRLYELFTETVGNDADLIIGTIIYGFNHRELAKKLGLTHANSRKRSQRVLKRLGDQLKKNEVGCHSPPTQLRVSCSPQKKARKGGKQQCRSLNLIKTSWTGCSSNSTINKHSIDCPVSFAAGKFPRCSRPDANL